MELPHCVHEHDTEWIKEQISKLPPQMRFKALDGYNNVFSNASNSEPTAHKKSNKGREAANTRLRLFVSKFYKAAMGHTIAPPKA